MDGDLLRTPIAEAARPLGCSVKMLKRGGVEGRLEIVKDGSRLYVPEASLRAYAGEMQAAVERAAGWQGLADLRVLFRSPSSRPAGAPSGRREKPPSRRPNRTRRRSDERGHLETRARRHTDQLSARGCYVN